MRLGAAPFRILLGRHRTNASPLPCSTAATTTTTSRSSSAAAIAIGSSSSNNCAARGLGVGVDVGVGVGVRGVASHNHNKYREWQNDDYYYYRETTRLLLARGTTALAIVALLPANILSRDEEGRSRSLAECSSAAILPPADDALPSSSSVSSSADAHDGTTNENGTDSLFAEPVRDIHDVYEIGHILGEGGYGQVFHATFIEDGTTVALKCIPKEWTHGEEFRREISVLRRLNNDDGGGVGGGHRHICRMYRIHEGDDEYWMSMELIGGGELFEHLIAEGVYSEARAAVFLRQFAEALAFMHKAGVVHGDLKPENLLLSSWDKEKADLKVVDFGCSVILDKDDDDDDDGAAVPEVHSTLAYDPPEKLLDHHSLSPDYKSDVWAAGCILYIILTGSHPFDKMGTASDEEISELVKSVGVGGSGSTATTKDGGLSLLDLLVFDERTKDLSPSAIGLLRSMLAPDPDARATSEAVLRDPWVQGLTASWDALEGIGGKLEMYWRKEFRDGICRKFGGAAGVASDEQLRSVFEQIDEDGDELIEVEELMKVLQGSGIKPKYIREIFDAINLDHDNGISLEEFRSVMTNELPAKFYQKRFRHMVAKELQAENKGNMSEESFRAAVRRLFNSMDLDHNGSLDCHELRLLLRKLGVDENEISLLVASVDIDKDGSLTFDEFSQVMFDARSKAV